MRRGKVLQKAPNGLDEIIAIFGSIDDPDFESKNIVLFDLPYPLLYAGQPVHKARCHRLAVDNFVEALGKVQALMLDHECKETDCDEYGGIYCRRAIRGYASHASAHSWGIAIDLEPERYPLGSTKRFPDPIVDAFRACGFFYGGDFETRKDPMHFQLCTGY
jgi:hypothetical protein